VVCPSFLSSAYVFFAGRSVLIHEFGNAYIVHSSKILRPLACIIHRNFIRPLYIDFSYFYIFTVNILQLNLKTPSPPVKKNQPLMLYGETSVAYSEIHKNHRNTFTGQKIKFLNVNPLVPKQVKEVSGTKAG
jgi:hypothetical protein